MSVVASVGRGAGVSVERDFEANAGTELKTEKLLAKSRAMLLVRVASIRVATSAPPASRSEVLEGSWAKKNELLLAPRTMARLRSVMWLLQDVPRCAGPRAGEGGGGSVHGPLVLSDAVRMLRSRGQDGAILQRGTWPASRGDNGRQVGQCLGFRV